MSSSYSPCLSERQTATNEALRAQQALYHRSLCPGRNVSPVREYYARLGVTMPYDDEEEDVETVWRRVLSYLSYFRRGPELVSTSPHAEPQDRAALSTRSGDGQNTKSLAQRRGWAIKEIKTHNLDQTPYTDASDRAPHTRYPPQKSSVCVGNRNNVCRCAANSRFHPITGETEYSCGCGGGVAAEYLGEWQDLHPISLAEIETRKTMLQSGVQGVFGGNPYKC